MAPTISRETAKTLADTVNMVKLIDQQDKKIQPHFRKMYDGLKAAIDDASADEIELYRPQLAKVVDEIDDALNSVQGALGLLSQLRDDKDLMETKFEQVEKLVKSVAAIRKRLSEDAAQARKLDHEVDQALGTIKKGELSAEADLGALQAQVKGLMKTIAYVDTEAPKLEQAARKAWDKKDQKTLTDSRLKLIDFKKYGTAAMAMKPRIEKYKKQYPDLDREKKAEVQWLLDDLDRADDSIKRVDRMVRELIALGQVPKEEKKAAKEEPKKPPKALGNAEVHKVVKEFGLDTNDIDLRVKAMKILNSCPIDQWPRELAKVYGVKESELKAKLNNVRKLPFVTAPALIDI
jgi:hypothetical protein